MSGPAFRVVLEESMQDHPVKAVIYSGLLALIDVGVNIVLSGLLEAVFPKYDPGKNVWLGGLEAVAEIALHVVFSNMFLLAGRGHPGALWGPGWHLPARQRAQETLRAPEPHPGSGAAAACEKGAKIYPL